MTETRKWETLAGGEYHPARGLQFSLDLKGTARPNLCW